MPSTDPISPTPAITFEWPTTQTSLSGYIYDPKGTSVGHSHPGIDISATLGQKIFAPESGTVEFAGWNSQGYGNLIIIKGVNDYRFYMAHLSQIGVKEGDTVNVGELIGKAGSTGNSTGPHLHFEVHSPTGAPIDPYTVFGSHPTPGVQTGEPGTIFTSPAAPATPGTSPAKSGSPLQAIKDFLASTGNSISGAVSGAANNAAASAGNSILASLAGIMERINWGTIVIFILALIIITVGVGGLVSNESSKIAGAAIGKALQQ